jgi:hypothetical protein
MPPSDVAFQVAFPATWAATLKLGPEIRTVTSARCSVVVERGPWNERQAQPPPGKPVLSKRVHTLLQVGGPRYKDQLLGWVAAMQGKVLLDSNVGKANDTNRVNAALPEKFIVDVDAELGQGQVQVGVAAPGSSGTLREEAVFPAAPALTIPSLRIQLGAAPPEYDPGVESWGWKWSDLALLVEGEP